jgi:hypothetical protein
MARFVLDRGLPIERLVSYRLSLGQASEGFRIADAANEGKVAFVWAD